MTEHTVNEKRNIAVVGHHGTGKTSLIEAILYYCGATEKLGKVDDGTSFADYLDEEKAHKHTVSSKVFTCQYKNTELQFIDTPGYSDFVGDIKGALHAADGALLVVNAQNGVEVETEKIWDYILELEIPRIVVVNQMDKEHANFKKTMHDLEELGAKVCPVRLPFGQGADFKGVIDLITDKVLTFDDKGKVASEEDIPADIFDEVEEFRQKMIEASVVTDEALMERYLEGEELKFDEIRHGLHDGALTGATVPMLVTDAHAGIGIQSLLDGIVNYIPTPLDRHIFHCVDSHGNKLDLDLTENGPGIGFVFKSLIDPFVGKVSFIRVMAGQLKGDCEWHNHTKGTKERVGHLMVVNGKQHTQVPSARTGDIVAVTKIDGLETNDTVSNEPGDVQVTPTLYPQPPVYVSLHAEDKNDEDKLGNALPKLISGDPTILVKRDTETHEIVISAAGQMQIDLLLERLKTQFNLKLEATTPKVAYRETISASGEGSYRHKKQSGGRGQFGEVHMRLKPLERGKQYEFINSIFGGSIPTRFVPAVEKGIQDAMERGIVAGFPVVDLSVEVFDGKYHDVDSSEMAFKTAASMCVRQVAKEQCKPILLEPVMNVKVIIPEIYMGDVIGDLNTRRGRVQGMEPVEKKQQVNATVPLAEMYSYSIDLRSITQGRGYFEMEFSHYDPVPSNIAQDIISNATVRHDDD